MLQANRLNLIFNTENKKNDFIGFTVNTRPFVTYDFYEPRSENEKRFVQIPEQIQFYFFLSQNYNRKLAIDFNPYFTFLNERERVKILMENQKLVLQELDKDGNGECQISCC